MINIFITGLSFAIIIFVWKNSNFLVDYYNWFELKGLKWLDDYNKRNENGFIENFFDYIAREKSDYYGIKLLTCPICLSVWCGILCIPFVWWKFLAVSYLVLFFYYILEKITKK